MDAPGVRRATASAIVGVLLCVWLLGVVALAQFVDVTSVFAPRAAARAEPPGLPALPERVTALPESVEQLRAMLAARARCLPDARFLRAVADVHRIHRGMAAPVSARFDGGRWTVLHGNTIVGSLPEVPGFGDARSLLAAWSRSLTRPPPRAVRAALPPEAAGWALLAPGVRVVPVLDRLGALWTLGVRSPELLTAAGRAAASLMLATPADTELSDAVEARALAVLALAVGADLDPPDLDAVVAWRLGYRAEARARLASLPTDHPARAALTRAPAPAEALPRALASLEAEAGAARPPAEEGVCLAHASSLASRRTPNGPFLDRELLALRDGAVLAASILRDLRARERANGPRAALAYVTVIDRDPPEGLRPLLAWARHMARVAADDEAAETLLHLLTPSAPTPASLLAESARRVAGAVAVGNARRQQAHDFLSTHLDARPAHRALRAEAARRDELDRILADALCAEVERVAEGGCPAVGEGVYRAHDAASEARAAGDRWRARRDDEAARVVARRAALHDDDRAEALARAFAEVFRGRVREVGPAVAALASAGVDFELQAALGDALGRAGDAALALSVFEAVEAPDPLAATDLLVRAWRVRVRRDGDAAATTWLRGAVPSARRGAVALAAYRHGAFDALWTVASVDVDDVAHREYIWLLRAMASVRSGPNDPRRSVVTTHFLGEDSNEYGVIGRGVLGRAAPRDVLALAESEPLRVLSLYALGARAEGEGRLAVAADWYQLARLAGAPSDRETRWAIERLLALGAAGRPP